MPEPRQHLLRVLDVSARETLIEIGRWLWGINNHISRRNEGVAQGGGEAPRNMAERHQHLLRALNVATLETRTTVTIENLPRLLVLLRGGRATTNRSRRVRMKEHDCRLKLDAVPLEARS